MVLTVVVGGREAAGRLLRGWKVRPEDGGDPSSDLWIPKTTTEDRPCPQVDKLLLYLNANGHLIQKFC